MIKHLLQPKGSSLCGQACVAMICGIGIDQARTALLHSHGTTSPQLIKALSLYNVKALPLIRLSKHSKVSAFDECYYPYLPKRCIAKLRSKGVKTSHWVLIWNGRTYDPDPPCRYGREEGYEYISAYIPIPI